MQLIPIDIKPGIDKETPSLSSAPAWRDANLVRFKSGQPQKMGGWTLHSSGENSMIGVPRSIVSWRSNSGQVVSAVGTSSKLYIVAETVFDITPVRTPQVNLDNPFDTNGTTTVTVNWVAHGCTVGDFVLINHATSVDFVDVDVNQRLVISNVVADAFDITIDNAATGTTTGTGGFGVHLTCLETIANPFAAISGDPVLAVAHTAHGASTGDYVTYFDATSTDFDDAVVNTNHLITAVDADNYTITMSSNALATSAGVTGGNVVFQYEVPVGNIDAISNVGFGAGGFGLEPWGTIRVISTDTESLRYWSLDHFGESNGSA